MTWQTIDTCTAKPGEPVLVWDGSEITVAHRSRGNNPTWFVHDSYGFNEDGEIPYVTHWMPLPEPPHASS
jgi:hypothetical protein